ncbi:MAG: hypothetical protein VX438_14530, partial [Planctomycetota bacterium]|nr:hypothetical protein [Planctomycetota bacterium]
MLAILGISWPSINRRLQKSDLKQAALQLKEELLDARSSAIQEGRSWKLRFHELSNRYQLGPSLNFRHKQLETPFEEISVGEDIDNFREMVAPSIDFEFDPSIRFTIQTAQQLATTNFDDVSENRDALQFGLPSDKRNPVETIHSVTFNPAGRSTDFEFLLIDQISKLGIELQVRGLTGQLEIGEIIRVNPQFDAARPNPERDQALEQEN